MGLASGPEILGFDAKRPKKNRRRDWLAAGRPCLLPGETRWGLGSDYLRVFLDLAGHDPLDVLDSVAVDAQLPRPRSIQQRLRRRVAPRPGQDGRAITILSQVHAPPSPY